MIVSVNEVFPRESSSSSNERTYTRHYQALSDVFNESELQVKIATGLPKRGQIHPEDGQAVCNSVTIKQNTDNPKVWECDIEYSTRVETNADVAPLLRPPQYSARTYKESQSLVKAFKLLNQTGNYTGIEYRKSPIDVAPENNLWVPVHTSAGQIFDPPLSKNVRYLELSITRNEQMNPVNNMLLYVDTINSQLCNGYPAFTMYMDEISANLTREEFEEQEYVFYEVNYRILVNPRTWHMILTDYGSQFLNYTEYPTYLGISDNTTAVTDAGEVSDTQPYQTVLDSNNRANVTYLNGVGEPQQRPPGQPIKYFHRAYQIQEDRDFNLLNLF